VRGGAHPLDASAVHPERYALVERMAGDLSVPLAELIGNESRLAAVELSKYTSDDVGLPTLRDILAELKKPGRDPREAFEAPAFRADITEPKHLSAGMELEGVVTNIVAFGAFVDVGVHQDGLVHVSQLADRYVSDPNAVVRVGQKVRVTVISVDLDRNRIALTMKQAGSAQPRGERPSRVVPRAHPPAPRPPTKSPPPQPPKPGDVAPNGMRFR
jgi:protein Tex